VRRSSSRAPAPGARRRPNSRKERDEHLDQALVLLAAIVVASLTAACGGSRTPVGGAPPPTGNFSNANLKGQYAFLMSGTEICSGLGSFFTRAGSFTADGSGHITGGLEDVNVCTGVFTLQFTNSTYSITADGRGTLSLTTPLARQPTASRFLPRPGASLRRPM